jgi:hypothetical protein
VFRLWKVRNPDRRYDCGRVRGGEPRGHIREAREVGPDDVIESDVDPHELATCHHGSGRQLCCGPGG